MNNAIIKGWMLILLIVGMSVDMIAQTTKKKTEKTKIVETFLESKPELDEDSIPIGRKRDEFITIDPELMVITSKNKVLPFDVPFYFTGLVKNEIYKITCYYMEYDPEWLDDPNLFKPILNENGIELQRSKQDLLIDSLLSHKTEVIMKSEWKSPSKILVDTNGEKQRFLLPIEPLKSEEEYLFSFAFTFKVDDETHENLKKYIIDSYNDQLVTARLYDHFRKETLKGQGHIKGNDKTQGAKYVNYNKKPLDFRTYFKVHYEGFLDKQYQKINNSIRDTLVKKYFSHSQLVNENYTAPILIDTLYKNKELVESLEDYIFYNKNHFDYYYGIKSIYWNDKSNPILNENISTPNEKVNTLIKAYIKAYKNDPYLLLKALRGFAHFNTEKGAHEILETRIDSSCYDLIDYYNNYCYPIINHNIRMRDQELEKIIHYLDMLGKDKLKNWFLELFSETLNSYEWLNDYNGVNDKYNEIVSTTSQKLVDKLTSNLVSNSYNNTIGSFLTRAESYISADFGFNVMYDLNDNFYINPHVAVGFGFGPLNRQAKYDAEKKGNWSFILGVSYKNEYGNSQYTNLFGDFDLLTGIGYRFNDFARISVGGRWNRKEQFDQLDSKYNPVVNPYIGLSIDWDVKNFFKNIFNKL